MPVRISGMLVAIIKIKILQQQCIIIINNNNNNINNILLVLLGLDFN